MPQMPDVELLVQASQARRSGGRLVGAYLGHLSRRDTVMVPWRGAIPGRLEWQETYHLQRLVVARPSDHPTQVEVSCRICHRPITLVVRSRWLAVRYGLAVAILAGLGAWVAFACCPQPLMLVWGALASALLGLAPEILGESDHHSPMRVIQPAPHLHQVFPPQAVSGSPLT